jgi:hypothetical protein
VQPFIDAFNAHRVKQISPGKHLLVDELMSFWLGLEKSYHLKGMPHVTKIPRKPRSRGVEVKAAGCSETGLYSSDSGSPCGSFAPFVMLPSKFTLASRNGVS